MRGLLSSRFTSEPREGRGGCRVSAGNRWNLLSPSPCPAEHDSGLGLRGPAEAARVLRVHFFAAKLNASSWLSPSLVSLL